MERIDTLVVGGGQAGLAMSEHLARHGIDHLVLERHRIAERWRTERWDTLVANGPAWHDRFPSMEIPGVGPDAFATRDDMARYFEAFAEKTSVPIRCGVNVEAVTRRAGGGFDVVTSQGPIRAERIVAATGPFQIPAIPPLVPLEAGPVQMHSAAYKNPDALEPGAVLVIGAGSSGAQIAEDLRRAGRSVYLSVGPHDRPPRRYRGKDFVWWLGKLGKWQMTEPPNEKDHVTIAVSGWGGGRTIDFRDLAASGITLVGMAEGYRDGVMTFAADLKANILRGDDNYLSLLREADAYVSAKGLDFPEEAEAHRIGALPDCATTPVRKLDLARAGVTTILWATGYTQNFDWLKVDAFDAAGKPRHVKGVSSEPGVYFVGLPWLSMRGSAFIWGAWVDAERIAGEIAAARLKVASA